jgi:photosystem II stability/assembly factor-like uncharacterized protein
MAMDGEFHVFNRVVFSVAVCLCLAATSLMAHDPHDPIVTVAVSPNFAQDSTIYAATDSLAIKLGVYVLLKSTNGGITWSAVAGLPNVKRDVGVALSPAYSQDQTVYTLFIVTANMTVFESTNRGQTFTQIALPGSIGSALSVIAVSPNFDVDGALLLGTATNGIYESTNGGSSWVSVTPAQPPPAVTALAFSPSFSSDRTAFAGTAAGVLISTSGGASWSASNAGLTDTNVNSVTLSPNYLQDSCSTARPPMVALCSVTHPLLPRTVAGPSSN